MGGALLQGIVVVKPFYSIGLCLTGAARAVGVSLAKRPIPSAIKHGLSGVSGMPFAQYGAQTFEKEIV